MLDVLLVEDELDHATLIREAWEVGCSWRIAEHSDSLDAAFAALTRREFDLVLLDLNLPESRGLDTLSRVRSAYPDLPVVILTSLEDHQFARTAIRNGADDYLAKTMLSAELLERSIRHAIERHRLLRELHETNRRLDSFAAHAAHDLAAPLTRIASLIDYLDASDELDLSDLGPSEALSLIRGECQRLSDLISSLLTLARLGNKSMQRESTNLTDIATQIRDNLAASIASRRASVEIADMPSAYVDRERVGLVLQNLIENGLKYQIEDQRPKISISAEHIPGALRIWVRDNGMGIAAEHHATIFEPFRRLHGDDLPGNGLGLAHCARIVRDHGGTIGVDSTPGQGSLFWFTIPTT